VLDGDLGVGDPKNITADWGHAKKEWKEAMSQFAIVWPERFEVRAR
jgi:transposase-like protein